MEFTAVKQLLSEIDEIFDNNTTNIEIEPILNQTRIKIHESDEALGSLKKLEVPDSLDSDLQSLVVNAYREIVMTRENLIQIFNRIKQYPERLVDRSSVENAKESMHKYIDDFTKQYEQYDELASHTANAEQRSALQHLISEYK